LVHLFYFSKIFQKPKGESSPLYSRPISDIFEGGEKMLSIGIVGLPNAGKSTLFNALVKGYQAKVAIHPFTTIKPNVGVVEVPDGRLNLIAERLNLPKQIPATIEFVDIAGLVKGAHKGEGLGNQFLAHIRECDAILHLVRFFDEGVPSAGGVVDPESDLEVVNTELCLKDLETIKKALDEKKIDAKRKEVLTKVLDTINQDKPAREAKLTEEELAQIADLNLLTLKPVLYVANVSEEQFGKTLPARLPQGTLTISAKLESDLMSLPKKEQKEYLKSLGESESGLDKIIKAAYKLLNLITFYTLLPNQVQAWSIQKGTKAKEAASKIHTDFEKKFIAVEICPFSELIKFKGWQEAQQKGKVRTEGRNYAIQDGDVVLFRHS